MRLSERITSIERRATAKVRLVVYDALTDEEQTAVDAGTFDPNAKVFQVIFVSPDGTRKLYRGQGRPDETIGPD